MEKLEPSRQKCARQVNEGYPLSAAAQNFPRGVQNGPLFGALHEGPWKARHHGIDRREAERLQVCRSIGRIAVNGLELRIGPAHMLNPFPIAFNGQQASAGKSPNQV